MEVSIAEMDVHTLNSTFQADTYSTILTEALDAGITDISFWGFTDKHAYTWVEGAKPLMFDEYYNPKGAFYATHTALASFDNKTHKGHPAPHNQRGAKGLSGSLKGQ
jgi:GH35 family endo-1,4-beta-xylanase